MNKINVLVFPAGEINSIELHDALSTCVNVKLYGASSIERHGEYVFENYIPGVPMITAPDFFEKFNELLLEYAIDVVFPTHDTIAAFFTDNKEKIKAKIVAADKETSAVCRDKEKTYNVFKDCDFVPETYRKIEKFPVFIKPKQGQGSVGAKLLKTEKDVADVDLKDYVICEYLPGEEYTVDCLTDKQGKLIFISPRSRQRIMAGISVAGRAEEVTEDIKNIAQTINDKLTFLGLWWFQIKKDKHNNWKLLEISTRCAGTMCLTRARGVNLPLLSTYIILGHDVEANANSYNVIIDRTLISRYKIDYEYDYVYFDFDDTLIFNNKVNLKAVWFLYQCKNLNKNVILITKHESILAETMERFAISEKLFDEIVHLKPGEHKINHIHHKKAIFIDNAYQERKMVARELGIPVFDVDGIDTLMDWRS